ncbi:MAG: RHS repeat-associated core domain-containing protein [Kiritimatiellae bacterium]|nr:RHS repeat-associated core domain-containing protein [Kiritimatiellia bacterium]
MVSSFDYTNDALGRRTARSDYYINRGSTEANTFGYNAFSEMTNAHMGTDTYSYAYDPIGNRNQEVKNSVATDYEANGLNQYTNITGGLIGTPTFDLDGNMTFLPSTSGAGGEGWHCQWDAENRLIGVSNLTTAVVASYTYDHQSRRIKKICHRGTETQSKTFVWDSWNLICEQTSTNNSSFIPHNSSFYTWGLDLSGTLQGAGSVGGLLCETKVANSVINTYYALADANGNITEYLNDSGTVVAHYEYDAFGNTSASSGDMVDDFVFRFSSKYLDAETGLYYYGYRYYDPVTGRWLNRDPKGERSGLLLYGFVRNDAANVFDLLGLLTMSVNPKTSEGLPWMKGNAYDLKTGKPAEMGTLELYVNVKCGCVSCKEKPRIFSFSFLDLFFTSDDCLKVSCSVGINMFAVIANLEGGWSIEGMYGHEQEHVSNILERLDVSEKDWGEYEENYNCSSYVKCINDAAVQERTILQTLGASVLLETDEWNKSDPVPGKPYPPKGGLPPPIKNPPPGVALGLAILGKQ